MHGARVKLKTLVLGTANFGSNYGRFNPRKVESSEVDLMLNWAIGKIPELDTSTDYPGSHAAIISKSSSFKITTKIDLSKINSEVELLQLLETATKQFGENSLYRILIRPKIDDRHLATKISNTLEKLKVQGAIKSIGASIYNISELVNLKKLNFKLDSIQLPASIANREFEDAITKRKLDLSMYSVYARSIFLQGMLLKSVNELPASLTGLSKLISAIRKESEDLEVTPIDLCLAYVSRLPWVNSIVIGANNLSELVQIYEAFNRHIYVRDRFAKSLPNLKSHLFDPRKW
jgi:predicted oxidoreductase